MKKNKDWFENVFLESFNERMKIKQSVWVTEKQVNVFRSYMKERKYYDGYYYRKDEFQYTLIVMKKGYGYLTKELKATAFV